MCTRLRSFLMVLPGLFVVVLALTAGSASTASAATAACFRQMQTGEIVCIDLQGNVVPPLVLQAMPQDLTGCRVDRVGDLFCPVTAGSAVFAQVLVQPSVLPVVSVQPFVFSPLLFRRIRLRHLFLPRCLVTASGAVFCG